MSRLVTPTGVLVTSAAPGSDDWHWHRAAGITATDLPKILGLTDQYGTALDVWAQKTGRSSDDEAGEAALWGNLLEDVVAREAAKRLNVKVRRVGVIANRDEPWQRASLDRLVVGECHGGRGGVEVKTRSAYVKSRWREGVPDDTLAQVVWQLVVSGLDHMHVAVLLGGQQLDLHVVRREEVTDIERLCLSAATDLWGNVTTDERPWVDPTPGLVDSLNRLFTTRAGTVVADQVALAMRDDYLAAAASANTAVVAKKATQAALMQHLADRRTVVDDAGKRLWGVTDTRTVDSDRAFTERLDLWREAAECGLVAPSIDSTGVRDEQPDLWAQLDAAGLITTSPRFTPPKPSKES